MVIGKWQTCGITLNDFLVLRNTAFLKHIQTISIQFKTNDCFTDISELLTDPAIAAADIKNS